MCILLIACSDQGKYTPIPRGEATPGILNTKTGVAYFIAADSIIIVDPIKGSRKVIPIKYE